MPSSATGEQGRRLATVMPALTSNRALPVTPSRRMPPDRDSWVSEVTGDRVMVPPAASSVNWSQGKASMMMGVVVRALRLALEVAALMERLAEASRPIWPRTPGMMSAAVNWPASTAPWVAESRPSLKETVAGPAGAEACLALESSSAQMAEECASHGMALSVQECGSAPKAKVEADQGGA